MRKITKAIKDAFEAGVYKSIDNTYTDGKAVYLHGNKIIERRDDGVYFNFCGWATPTTKERINGILFSDTSAGVYTKQFELYFLDEKEPIDSEGWYCAGDQYSHRYLPV